VSRRNLAGGTALVTGGTSGIGKAVCHMLASAGLRVVLTGRDAERAEQVRRALTQPSRHHVIVGDLAQPEFTLELAEKTSGLAGGALSVLVHAAGSHVPQALATTTLADFDAALATNLRAPFVLSVGLLPALKQARGQVVFVNSSAVNNPRPELAAYTASKAGLRAFADSLRGAVNADGVRVLSVFPGRTATPMQREQYEREGRTYRPELLMQPEDVADAIGDALSLAETVELTELHLRPNLKS
jgi:NAD(P)-dependent dehydrogenase (short-subunit alcohol dehydrogenase family)